MKLLIVGTVAVLAVLGGACSGAKGGIDEPPSLRLGVDICAQCGMIISDERFAAAYTTTGRTHRLFDDIGDMALYHSTHREDVARFWVHDFESLEWLDAERAWYVRSDGIMTPMGHGVAAYATLQSAQAAVERVGGNVLEWQQIIDLRDPATEH
jgi:copper chaperone NosL